jgi:hypothetical protein
MRRLCGRRWNAMARAEFRRHFSTGTIAGMIGVMVLAYGGAAAALIWADSFRTASAIVRGITWICWALSFGYTTLPVQRMFVQDRELGVTEQWLLTPLPRREVLASRAAGTVLNGPFFVLLMAPLYFVGAAGLSSAQYGLFALGHLARLFSLAPAPGEMVPAEVLFSAPVAVLAMLTDISMCVYSSFGALTGALQTASRKHFWKDIARSFTQMWELTLYSFGWGMLMIAVEGICGAGAGIFCALTWEHGSAGYAVAGVLVTLAVVSVATADRLFQVPFYVKLAGRFHDAILLEDDPGTRED